VVKLGPPERFLMVNVCFLSTLEGNLSTEGCFLSSIIGNLSSINHYLSTKALYLASRPFILATNKKTPPKRRMSS